MHPGTLTGGASFYILWPCPTPPQDTSLNAVRTAAQVAAGAGLGAAALAGQWDLGQLLGAVFGVVAVLMADQVRVG